VRCASAVSHPHVTRLTPMKVLAIGLLAIIALGSGDLTASANDLKI
jgi:hypothetical protein